MSELSPPNDRLPYIRFCSAGSENSLQKLWGAVGCRVFMDLRDCSRFKHGFYILFMASLRAASSGLAFITVLGLYCPTDPGEIYRLKPEKR